MHFCGLARVVACLFSCPRTVLQSSSSVPPENSKKLLRAAENRSSRSLRWCGGSWPRNYLPVFSSPLPRVSLARQGVALAALGWGESLPWPCLLGARPLGLLSLHRGRWLRLGAVLSGTGAYPLLPGGGQPAGGWGCGWPGFASRLAGVVEVGAGSPSG